MKFKYLYSFLVLMVSVLHAQDLHFSQYNENPSLINPALTGSAAPLRVSLINREQWRSVSLPYRTFGASFETRFNSGKWEQGENKAKGSALKKNLSRLAVGFSIYTDKAGDGSMGLTQGNLSLATFVPFSKKTFLSLGLQGSLAQRSLNSSKLIFSNQYNGFGYDQNIASNENFSNANFTYADLGSGVLWSYSEESKRINGNKQLKVNVGISVYHLNRAKQKFLTSADRLFMRYVFHGDALVSLPGTNLALAPSLLFQLQGPSKEIQVGGTLKYYMKNPSLYTGIVKRNAIGVGLYYRNGDAVILSGLLEWQEKFAVGISYDFNVSRLSKVSSSRGGFEITLRYTKQKASTY